MKNYRSPKLLILCGSLLMFSPFQAYAVDPSPDTTRLLASQCAQCHGTTGNTLGGFDSIAGEGFQELYSELLEMKADNDNKIMHKQIKAYTDDQIFFIADYYSRLPDNSNGDGGNDSGDFGESNDSNDSDDFDEPNDSNSTLSKAELKAKKKREKEEAKAAKKRKKALAKEAKKRAKAEKKGKKEAKKRAKALKKSAKKRAKTAAKAAKKRERENR